MQRNVQAERTDLALLFSRVARFQGGMVNASHGIQDSGDFARIFERQKVQYRRDDDFRVKAREKAKDTRPPEFRKPLGRPQNPNSSADNPGANKEVRQARDGVRPDSRPGETAGKGSNLPAKQESRPDEVAAPAGAEAQNPQNPADAGQLQAAAVQMGGQGQATAANSSAGSASGVAGEEAASQPVMAQQAGVTGLTAVSGMVVTQVSGEAAVAGQVPNGQEARDSSALPGLAGQGSKGLVASGNGGKVDEQFSDLIKSRTGSSQVMNGQEAAQTAGGMSPAGVNLPGEGTSSTSGAAGNALNPLASAQAQLAEGVSVLSDGKKSAAEGNPGAGQDGNLTLRIRYALEHLDDRGVSGQAGSLPAAAGMEKSQQGGTNGQQGFPGTLVSGGQSAEAFKQAPAATKSTQGTEFMSHLLQTGAAESQDAGRAGFEAAKAAHGARPSAETVLPQIVQKAQVILRDGSSEMRMQLVPEHLGKLEMKIVVHDGMVTARFMVENAQVKSMIEGNLAQLKQSLESMGFHIDSFAVGVGAGQKEAFGSSWSGADRGSSAEGGSRHSRLRRVRDYEEAVSAASVPREMGVLRSNPYHLVDARM